MSSKEAILDEILLGSGNTEHAAHVQDYVQDMWYTLEVLARYFSIEKIHTIVEAGMPPSSTRLDREFCLVVREGAGV